MMLNSLSHQLQLTSHQPPAATAATVSMSVTEHGMLAVRGVFCLALWFME
jgi:hypothetical protein